MKNVFASEPSKNNATKHVDLVQRERYVHKENSYELFDNIDGNSRELLEE
jgi:hypothetical protein